MLGKRTVTVLLATAAILAVSVPTGYIALAQFLVSMTVHQGGSVQNAMLSVSIGGQTITDNSTVSWGTLIQGQNYTKSISITNTGGVTLNVTFTLGGMQAGWSETTGIPSNFILSPGNSEQDIITLSVPSNANLGDPGLPDIIIHAT